MNIVESCGCGGGCGHCGNDVMEACMAPHIRWCIILWSAIMAQDGDAYGNTVTFNKCCLSHVWYKRRSCSGIGNTHTHISFCLSKDLACNSCGY